MPDKTSRKSNEPHPQSTTQPWWMKGAFRPVTEESTVADLSVTGELPTDLNGRLLRIGPNPPTGQSPHWFLGAGMVHEIEFCNGTAKAYRNRYIMTDYFEAVSNGRPPSLGDPRSSMANPHRGSCRVVNGIRGNASADSARWEPLDNRTLRLRGRTQNQHDCTPKDMPQNR